MPVILRKKAPAPSTITIDIPSDIKIHCKRLDTPLWCHAQALAREIAAEDAKAEGREQGDLPDGAKALGLAQYYLMLAAAQLSWIGWDGFEDEDRQPVPFDPDLIPLAIRSEWDIAVLWYSKYTSGAGAQVAEKNGSGNGGAGTVATAPIIAATVPIPEAPVPEASPA